MTARSFPRRGAGIGAVLAAFAGSLYAAHVPAPTVSTYSDATFGQIEVVTPGVAPKGIAFVLSDRAGITPQLRRFAVALARDGVITVPIDLPVFEARLNQGSSDSDDCQYITDDFKDTAQSIERTLGLGTYLWPTVIGFGEGGGLAYGAVAQAPANTIAGAISIGWRNIHHLDHSICQASPNLSLGPGAWRMGNSDVLEAPWTVLAPDAASAARDRAFAAPLRWTHVREANGWRAITAQVLAELRRNGPGANHRLADLPLIVQPGSAPTRAVALFISGDGGWRDIDKTLGDAFAAHGVSVVGIDALRYFWTAKTPQQIADDLTRLADTYGAAFGTRRLILAGFSFGADVLPFVWPLLPARVRDRVDLISLIGLEPTADFRITANGYLGRVNDTSVPVAPALAGLPLERVQCVYGTDEVGEGDTACIDPALDEAERVIEPGGHHFDGDYTALAGRLLAGLDRRQVATRQPPERP